MSLQDVYKRQAQGDLVAFYQEKDGVDHLLVRRLLQVNGVEYVVADEAVSYTHLDVYKRQELR